MSDVAEELEKLASLRDRGVLTQEEFDQQKALILHPPVAPAASPPPPPPPPAVVAPPPIAPAPAPAQVPTPADFSPDKANVSLGYLPPKKRSAPVNPPFAASGPIGGSPADTSASAGAAPPPAPGAANVSMGYLPPRQPGTGAGPNKILMIVGGGMAVLLVVVVALWAIGMSTRRARPAYPSTPYSSSRSTLDSPGTSTNSGASSTVGDGGDNPLLGAWAIDNADGNCPSMMTFKETTAVVTSAAGSSEVPMSYEVQSGETVVMVAPDRPSARTTATISGGRYLSLSDGGCRFHRV